MDNLKNFSLGFFQLVNKDNGFQTFSNAHIKFTIS